VFEISFQFKIKIALPKLSLLLNLWWSTYWKDLNNGYIARFAKIYHTAPDVMGAGSYVTLLDSSYNRAYSLGVNFINIL
jgi:hypothetical protein